MAIYEPQPELLVSNFPDVLLDELASLEMRSAFAIEPEPGRTAPRPGAGRIRSSHDLAKTITRSAVKPGVLLGIALDAKLGMLHTFAVPLLPQTRPQALDAMRVLQATAVLGGGTSLVIVRYDPLPEDPLEDLARDKMLELVQKQGPFMPAPVHDFVWIDPSGKYVSALDAGLM